MTADDYVAQALLFPRFSKARAVALNWNTVALYIAPTGNGEPSDILQRDMLAYFEDKRILAVWCIKPPGCGADGKKDGTKEAVKTRTNPGGGGDR